MYDWKTRVTELAKLASTGIFLGALAFSLLFWRIYTNYRINVSSVYDRCISDGEKEKLCACLRISLANSGMKVTRATILGFASGGGRAARQEAVDSSLKSCAVP
jgi:hypothetical protein